MCKVVVDEVFIEKMDTMANIYSRVKSLSKILLSSIYYGLDDDLNIRDIESLCIILHNELKLYSENMEYVHLKLGL